MPKTGSALIKKLGTTYELPGLQKSNQSNHYNISPMLLTHISQKIYPLEVDETNSDKQTNSCRYIKSPSESYKIQANILKPKPLRFYNLYIVDIILMDHLCCMTLVAATPNKPATDGPVLSWRRYRSLASTSHSWGTLCCCPLLQVWKPNIWNPERIFWNEFCWNQKKLKTITSVKIMCIYIMKHIV